ncbi:hypothetical protein [Streptomyces sp. 1331.2]|uniref:hypothetical protein n=1 Tax=Streptomyces sp. 1331.2 TaxID=1938835 RepID=UPI000BDDD916|nr:hypothetical protein [Streptomyces sp. 1331.2]SOB86004.1 hypothetical protein SAMN06272789_6306 [Streptomyces sp. 1331.2]
MRGGELVGGLGRLVGAAAGAAAELGEAGRQAVLRGGRAAAGGRWALTALGSVPPPSVPATEPWKLSVGTLIGRHPRTPTVVHKLLGLLDGLGAVHLGPTEVGFDGEEIAWDKVVEIRTRNAFEVLTTTALEQEVDRVREFLPPVPGRKWVVTKAGEALATVVLAALERGSVDQRLDELTVPARIVHRGLLGRPRTLDAGVFAAAVLVVTPPGRRKPGRHRPQARHPRAARRARHRTGPGRARRHAARTHRLRRPVAGPHRAERPASAGGRGDGRAAAPVARQDRGRGRPGAAGLIPAALIPAGRSRPRLLSRP